MAITTIVMGIFSAGAMTMGAMCIITANADLQVALRLTLAVLGTLAAEGMLAVGEVEGDEMYGPT